MSKQSGLGVGAHILPVVPAGPSKIHHTEKYISINEVGGQGKQRGRGRMRSYGDNELLWGRVQARVVLVEQLFK